MKREMFFMFLGILLLSGCVSIPPSEDGIIVPLDKAIREAAQRFKAELDEGTTVAVLKFNSSSPRFDDYVIQEMELALVGGKRLVVKERKHLQEIRDLINSEYQSGYVSDETLVSIAKEVGTQVVVVGDLFDMDDTYRFRVRVVMNETATIETAYAVDLHPNERKVRNLMKGKRPQKIQLAEVKDAPDFFERNKDRARIDYMEGGAIGFAWGEGMGFSFDLANIYFSPLPYLSLGIGGWDLDMLFLPDSEKNTIYLFFLQAGTLIPVTKRITFVGYGTLRWLELTFSKDSELTEETPWLIGSGNFGIIPGIKTGFLFEIGNDSGLAVNYKRNWIKDGYINAVGIGLYFLL